MKFDHKIYFDSVRQSLFSGSMTQLQVDGQEALLTAWEQYPASDDLRHFAYMLATTYHETAQTMQPIEEYGKGAGMPYGKKDPQTGQIYYGRGFVMLTWRDNYHRATVELGLTGDDDLEWHAARALDPEIASRVMGFGMSEGWFRKDSSGVPESLGKFFNATRDDPYNAREIINGDKATVPSWSHGVSIGKLIEGYHDNFLQALSESTVPESDTITVVVEVRVTTNAPMPVQVVVKQVDATS